MSAIPAPSERINQSARDWFMRMVVETPSQQTRIAFEEWRAADPLHARAYSRYTQLWSEAAELEDLAHLAADRPENRVGQPGVGTVAAWRRWSLPLTAAGVAVLALATWQIIAGLPQHFATGIGENRDLVLADGSHVALGARSAIEVSLSGAARQVTLAAGEAYFEVTHDPSKPFVIDIGQQQVRVVGTKFDIRRANEAMRVSVLEGVVQVVSAGVSDPVLGTHVLHAGQQLDAETMNATVVRVGALTGADPVAWRRGKLVYVDATLREVVADANRYLSPGFVIRDEGLANERVSVAYPAGQVAQMMQGLAQAVPFTIHPNSTQPAQIDRITAPRP